MSLQPKTFAEAQANFKPMRRAMSTKKKPKKIKVGKLKDKVWKQFSIFIRTRGADTQGFNFCVTCQVKKFWRELQAGHFIQGRLNANLFDERGTNPQCYSCNVGRYGATVLYYKWMLAHYGQEVIDDLLEQNSKTHKWQPDELENLLIHYTALNGNNPITLVDTSL